MEKKNDKVGFTEGAPAKIPKGEEELECDCEDGGDVEVKYDANGDILAECIVCGRFRKYPAA